MDNAMVTGRMLASKKEQGNRVLERYGMNASQAINELYSRLIKEQEVGFLTQEQPTQLQWESAARLVDSIVTPEPRCTRFDDMTRGEIALDRARAKGRM